MVRAQIIIIIQYQKLKSLKDGILSIYMQYTLQ